MTRPRRPTAAPPKLDAGHSSAPSPRLHPAGRILLALTIAQFVLVFAQAVLAGNLLAGSPTSRVVHEILGTQVITIAALGQVAAAAIHVWRGNGTPTIVAATAALFAAITWQVMLGFDSRLALHVPFGVVILLAQPAIAIAIVRHRTPRPALLLVVVLAAVLTGCAGQRDNTTVATGPADSDTITIETVDNAFIPAVVPIAAGEQATIEVSNLGDTVHNLVAQDLGIDTGLVQPGQTVQETLTLDGDYEFVCTIHPGMTGQFIAG